MGHCCQFRFLVRYQNIFSKCYIGTFFKKKYQIVKLFINCCKEFYKLWGLMLGKVNYYHDSF